MCPPFTIYLNKLSVLQIELYVSYPGKMLLSSSGTGKHDKLSPDFKWDKHKLNNSFECRWRAYHHNTFISKYDGFFVAFPKFLLPAPLPICSHLTDFLRDTVIRSILDALIHK